jgi:predicted phosphodiesterase
VGLKNVFYIIVVVLTANFASASYPSPVGLWQFDEPNHLNRASLGEDLVEVGTHSAVAGINAGDGAVADPIGSYFICNHGILPNGDGEYVEYVNDWTVMMDVKVPASSIGHWVALYQTNIDNSNDADCFIAPDRTIGVGDTGYTTWNKINGGIWYRIVISVSNMNFYRIYVNGSPWLNGTVQPLDGRFALDPQILFFADDDGEDYPIYCTNLAIWGQALEDSQILELGDTTTPIVIDVAGAAGSNLLENPSAENELDNWVIADGNDWQATDRTDWHYPHTGNYYFTAGRSAHAEINQVINLRYMATAIDSGSVIANVRGHLGGNDSDHGRIIVEYLDADDAVLATTDSDWVVGPNSVNWTQLVLPDADGFVIPSGTRSAKYRLLAQRTNGTDCHAYFDDLVWEYKLAAPGNNAPGIPSIAGPSSGSIGVDANYTFSAVDPDANQVAYQIDWGDEISDWSDFQSSGSDYIVQHNWPVLGIYSVRARSRDTNGGLSAWSSPTFDVTISGDAAGVFKSQPYLQNVSQNAITIAWETDRMVNPTVDWGLTSSYDNNTEGLCINAGLNGSSVVYVCKVRISGLAPQTTYHCRARNGSTLGSDATFKTAPDEQTPFSFAVAGDSQMVARRLIGDSPHPECSSAMFTDMASMADIAVSIGDVVDDSSYGLYVSAFRPYICNILGKQKPIFVAFGNHDEPSDSLVHKVVQNSGMHSFSFNYGNAHFTCIDYSDCVKGTLPSDGSIDSLPLGWIQQDLSSDDAQNATWRFLFIHVPPYCERWFAGSSLMQTYLVPLLNQYNVQMCFSGHTHEYERGMLNGTFYVVNGCMNYLDIVEPIAKDWSFMTVGGAQNIPGLPDGGGLIHGWTEVEIDGTKLNLIQHAYNLDGSSFGVIDTINFVQADFNGDKTVDFEDLAIFSDAWLSTPQDSAWNPVCDLADKAQKVIDFKDMAVFAQYWHFNGQF